MFSLVLIDVSREQAAEDPMRNSGAGKRGGPKAFPRVALDLATTVERIQQNFVIADPHLPDCPIVFASDAFLELTGYSREEILGRNCRFLQASNPRRCLLALKVEGKVTGQVWVRHRPPTCCLAVLVCVYGGTQGGSKNAGVLRSKGLARY